MRRGLKKLVIALPAIVSIPIIILRLLPINTEFLPENIFDILALSCLVGITGSLFVLDNDHLKNGLDTLSSKISDIFLFSKGDVAVIRPANEPSIWVGFKKKLYALNPPIKMATASVENYTDMVKSHAARYNDPEFYAAHYIFYAKGESGRYFANALDDFIKFTKDIQKIAPSIGAKIYVTIVDENAPGFTFFVGEKSITSSKGESRCPYAITYINEVPLMYQNGFSNWAFISLNNEYNSTLENYCVDIIHRHESSVFSDFIKSYETPTS